MVSVHNVHRAIGASSKALDGYHREGKGNFSAFSPDVPGCVATGATREEAEQEFQSALQMHLEGLKEDRLPIPKPSASIGYVEAWTAQSQTSNVSATRRPEPAIANAIWRMIGGILGLIGGALLGALIQLPMGAVIGSGADTVPTIAAIGGMILGLCFPRIAKMFVEILWALASFSLP
jgi:predicted RNase H-like HicB family nuclease